MSLALVFLTEIKGVSAPRAGLALSIAFSLSFATIGLLGRIISRIGPKASLIAATVLSIAGYSTYYFGVQILTIAIAAFVVASGDRLYAAAWPVMVLAVYGDHDLRVVFSRLAIWKVLLAGLGATTTGLMLSVSRQFGLQLALAINILSYAFSIPLLMASRTSSTIATRTAERSRSPLTDKPFMLLVLSQLLASFVWIMPVAFFPLYITQTLHAPLKYITVCLIVRYAVIFCSQAWVTSMTADWTRRSILCSSSFLGCTAVLSVALTSNTKPTFALPLLICGSVFACFSECLSKPFAMSLSVRMGGSSFARYSAYFQVTWMGALAVSPVLIGLTVSRPKLLWALLTAFGVSSFILEMTRSAKKWGRWK